MKLTKITIKFYLIFLLFFSISNTLFAIEKDPQTNLNFTAEELLWIKEHPTIRVQAELDTYPFNFMEGSTPTGYSNDFVKLLAKKIGIKLDFITGLTWFDYLTLLKEKKIDIISNFVQTQERSKFALFSKEPIHNFFPAIYTKDKLQRFNNLKELEGKTLAIHRGYWYEEILKNKYPKIKLFLVNSILEGTRAVANGKADAVVDLDITINYYKQKYAIENIFFNGFTNFEEVEKYSDKIGIRNDWKIFKSIVDKTIDSLSQKEKQILKNRWFKKRNVKSPDVLGSVDNSLNTKLNSKIFEKSAYKQIKYKESKKILVLHSYHNGFKWTDDITQGIKSLFPPTTNASLTIEYMGTKRRSDAIYFEVLKQNYKYLYAKEKFDLIIVSDNHAFDFLKKNQNELFPDTPVVFCGVNFIKEDQLKGFDNFTGVSEEADFSSTLNLAFKLHPNTKNVFLISDKTKTGNILIKRLKKDIKNYNKNITFIFPDESNIQSISQTIRNLPKDSIILYTLFFKDDKNIYYSYAEATQLISNIRDDIPIYGTWDYTLGHKIIGGKLISGFKQGLEAANIANKILKGQKAKDIKIIKEEATQFMFDRTYLDKFNIKNEQLPLSSIIFDEDNIIVSKKISLTKKEKAFIEKNPVIKVSNLKDWAPFDFSVGNKPQGYFIDVLKNVESRSGIRFEFVNGFSWDKLYNMYKNRQLDLIHPVVKNNKRLSKWLFTNPIYSYKTSYATKKGVPKINNINELYGKTVAVGKSFNMESFLKLAYPQIKLKPVTSVREGLDLVISGKAFAMIDSKPVLEYTSKKYFYSNIVVQGWLKEYDTEDRAKLYFMTHKDKPELISIINKSLLSITPNELHELEKKWFFNRNSKKIKLSKNEDEYLKDKKILKMCIIPNYMPYGGMDKEGKYAGISADILKIIEKNIGTKIELFQTKTWEESLNSIRDGKCDILPLAQKLPKREVYLNFTKPYITPTSVIATRNKELFVKDINEIKDKKIGIIKAYAFADLIKKVYPNFQIISVENIKEGLDKVQKGELYGYVDSLGAIGYELRKQGNYEIKVAGKIGFDLELSLASRKDEPILHSIFSKAIEAIPKSQIQNIFNKWISVRYEDKVDYTLIYQILAVMLIIVASFGIWNRKLKKEIRKREEIEKELIIAREEAVKASKAKGDFLANMSHEIRTPMNGIMGMTTLALGKIDSDINQAKDFLKKGQSSAKLLLGVINDILDFSKIEAGKLDVEIVPMSLRETISRINDIFGYTAKEKDLEFIIEQDELMPEYIMGDQLRLSQVLTNLTSNAIKFTQKGSVKIKIELLSKKDDNVQIKFLVQDTGKGISKENQEKLFNSFSQEDSSISREYGGTGLGLAISKELVQLMQGEIGFESKKEKGTIFFFTLNTKLVANKNVISKSFINKEKRDYESKKVLKTRILIVEDNDINRELAYNFIKEIVTDIDFATNGKQAVEMVVNKPSDYYSVVLMDIHMPIMDGFEATKIIRENKTFQELPIIALTANVLKSDIEKCKNQGMNDHIPKPFDVNQLHQKIYHWINKNGIAPRIKKAEYNIIENKLDELSILDAKIAIERMIGRSDLYKNFLISFLENRINDLEIIKEELGNNNTQNAISIIHTLKGIVNTMGAQRLGELLATKEQALKSGKSLDKKSINLIEKEFYKVIEEVKKWIKDN